MAESAEVILSVLIPGMLMVIDMREMSRTEFVNTKLDAQEENVQGACNLLLEFWSKWKSLKKRPTATTIRQLVNKLHEEDPDFVALSRSNLTKIVDMLIDIKGTSDLLNEFEQKICATSASASASASASENASENAGTIIQMKKRSRLARSSSSSKSDKSDQSPTDKKSKVAVRPSETVVVIDDDDEASLPSAPSAAGKEPSAAGKEPSASGKEAVEIEPTVTVSQMASQIALQAVDEEDEEDEEDDKNVLNFVPFPVVSAPAAASASSSAAHIQSSIRQPTDALDAADKLRRLMNGDESAITAADVQRWWSKVNKCWFPNLKI
jgi:hypothetical protein